MSRNGRVHQGTAGIFGEVRGVFYVSEPDKGPFKYDVTGVGVGGGSQICNKE